MGIDKPGYEPSGKEIEANLEGKTPEEQLEAINMEIEEKKQAIEARKFEITSSASIFIDTVKSDIERLEYQAGDIRKQIEQKSA